MNTSSNITIVPAVSYYDIDTYAQHTTRLLRDAFDRDPTVIPHTPEEMMEKYRTSVIALIDGRIIGQASMYPSGIPGYGGSHEIGSIVVTPEQGGQSVGYLLIQSLIETVREPISSIISATVNPRMYSIFEKNQFVQIEFPPSYLREGEQYLTPKMSGGIQEFHEKARCYFRQLAS